MINEDNTTQDIVYDDNQLFSILKLSELKGTNAVACTESIQCYYKIIYAFQDILIGGKINNGGHNYNVVQKNGKYRIVDVGQIVSSVLPNINAPYDLLTFGEFDTLNKRKRIMHYESEFKNEDSLKKTMYKVKRGKRCTILYSKKSRNGNYRYLWYDFIKIVNN